MEAICEEVEVINSIYEDIAELTLSASTVDVRIPGTSIHIRLLFPSQYPDKAPRVAKVSGAVREDIAIAKFQTIIDSTFVQGEVYLFTFIDEAKVDATVLEEEAAFIEDSKKESSLTPSRLVKGSQHIGDWFKSTEIRDKTSVFVGHAIQVSTELEMEELVDDLLSDKKLSNANINMVAWRIKLDEEGTQFSQDYDNDGEAGAGTCMLHVLEMADVQNVVVVVSRFFDGTHIGSDRFKHIKNCTRDALKSGGFLNK